jgi:hypothetical protein
MFRHVVTLKLTDVSEVRTAFIVRAVECQGEDYGEGCSLPTPNAAYLPTSPPPQIRSRLAVRDSVLRNGDVAASHQLTLGSSDEG